MEVGAELPELDAGGARVALKPLKLSFEAPIKKDSQHWMANNEEVCVLQAPLAPE